ncbi:outer membrane beta-barrel protein [Gynurincola endophyticus]|uniref:outer membrane beta-barrel protein n=1 Tax=Gynurincola endophyticus TaxID=2479004 RepID=UPI000F8E58EC|nr:outer membrane beta-barrel protein [Gynurincola endophyticus]
MKKIFAILVVGMSTFYSVNAQTDKGDWIVGGNLTLATPSNSTYFAVSPQASYFFLNNLAVGGAVDYTFSKAGSTKTNNFTIGPSVRYYFNLKEDHLKPLLHAGVGFGTQSTKTGNTKYTSNVTSANLGGGLAYFLNKNVAVETLVSWTTRKVKNIPAQDGLHFNIGFRIHLAGK